MTGGNRNPSHMTKLSTNAQTNVASLLGVNFPSRTPVLQYTIHQSPRNTCDGHDRMKIIILGMLTRCGWSIGTGMLAYGKYCLIIMP